MPAHAPRRRFAPMTTLTLDDAALARRAAARGLAVEDYLAAEYPPDPAGPAGAPADARPAGETAYDAFARLGVIGCVKGGPPDVATNPKYMEKYMEGFGES